MPNTQLRQHIDDMPGILAKLERIPEITTRLDLIDTLRAHALSLGTVGWRRNHGIIRLRPRLAREIHLQFKRHRRIDPDSSGHIPCIGRRIRALGFPGSFVFAARGVADGMAYVREYASERRELDPELIQRIHEVTALDLQPFARGTFRPTDIWRESPRPASRPPTRWRSMTTCKP